jgi:hypothetical protein
VSSAATVATRGRGTIAVRAVATIRERLVRTGAGDGTVNDFGSVHSMFFRDPDGLEGEVLIPKR